MGGASEHIAGIVGQRIRTDAPIVHIGRRDRDVLALAAELTRDLANTADLELASKTRRIFWQSWNCQ